MGKERTNSFSIYIQFSTLILTESQLSSPT